MIEMRDVTFAYPGGENDPPFTALRNISLDVERGSFTAVLGHNGSGKSTLAKLCNGLFRPTSGTVTVDGIDTADDNRDIDIRRKVGMVFQNPDNQMVATIVEEDVAFGPENLGLPPAEIRQRVDEALRTVEMYDYRLHAPHKLSGGQKQRIAIAGVIAMRPECIVFDESTAMLDPKGRSEVMNTILRLNREQGITVLLITHFMEEAALAARILVMDEGRIIMDGTPRNIFSQVERMRAVGLDVPEPTELMYGLRKNGIDIPHEMRDILTVDECEAALYQLITAF